MHKNALFLLKICRNRPALRSPPPDPLAVGGCGLCLQTFSLQRLGIRPQTPTNLSIEKSYQRNWSRQLGKKKQTTANSHHLYPHVTTTKSFLAINRVIRATTTLQLGSPPSKRL